MKVSKTAYLHTFTLIVLILGIVRLVNSCNKSVPEPQHSGEDSIVAEATIPDTGTTPKLQDDSHDLSFTQLQAQDKRVPHRILSVPRYDDAFPDLNDVQLEAAKKLGVSPVSDITDAMSRKSELVYVGASPWFHVDRLKSSSPYLVPKAAVLLQDIGRAFYDSLDIKGIPLHKIITTSVLRTRENVEKLRLRNSNATENSCHLYGTTFDICYNRYKTVENPNGPKRRVVTNDTLKWVLSEVLRDLRQNNRCYVKYEIKQGCFHITVR